MAAAASSWRGLPAVMAGATRSGFASGKGSAARGTALDSRNEGLLDALQQIHQLPAFLGGKAGEGVLDRGFGDAPDPLVDPLGFRRQVNPLDASVVWLGAALDP